MLGGGYIVTPLKATSGGKPRTLVEAVLEMDAAGWSSLLGAGFSSYPTHLRDSLLGVIGGVSHNPLLSNGDVSSFCLSFLDFFVHICML